MTLTTHYSEADKTVTIHIWGRFDFSVHREFRSAYKDHGGRDAHYLVDLKGTEYMDSSALGMLLLLREHAQAGDNSIRIVNCSDEIRQILTISNFARLFTIE